MRARFRGRIWKQVVQMVRETEALAAEKDKTIPEQYRKYTLIEFGPQGDYYISSKFRKLFTDARDA